MTGSQESVADGQASSAASIARPRGGASAGCRLDLSSPRRIHVVGIGGAGMSAIAGVLSRSGHQVSGSDLKETPSVERLRAMGIRVERGHRSENVGDVDAVAISTAVPATNPEVVWAAEKDIPVLSRADVLSAICDTRRTISVAGTHGKTTTSSMVTLALMASGYSPSAIIGGDVNEIGSGFVWSDSDLLVVEADESDGTFLRLASDVLVVTNVEPDHLDYYGSVEALRDSFAEAVRGVAEFAVLCTDDPGAAALADPNRSVTYGTTPGADYRIANLRPGRSNCTFSVVRRGEELGEVCLPVPGVHNALNATAAVAVSCELGADFGVVADALGRFGGVSRRFEFRGESRGVTFVDDYAHLPTEVRSAIAAACDGGWQRVVCVFQPHRYSRTAALWNEFGDAFDAADILVLTDIYPAGEDPVPGVTGRLVVDAVLSHLGELRGLPAESGQATRLGPVLWAPRRDELVELLGDMLKEGDLCLTLGAGDLTSLPDTLGDVLRGSPG